MTTRRDFLGSGKGIELAASPTPAAGNKPWHLNKKQTSAARETRTPSSQLCGVYCPSRPIVIHTAIESLIAYVSWLPCCTVRRPSAFARAGLSYAGGGCQCAGAARVSAHAPAVAPAPASNRLPRPHLAPSLPCPAAGPACPAPHSPQAALRVARRGRSPGRDGGPVY